jgi:L-aspartate oxidase
VRKRGIDAFENCLALDLIVQDGRAYGARVLNLEEKRVVTFLSKATILATGGVGQIYSQTSNPFIATGDGIAMAYRAGATIEDMEFVQFHPTTLQRRAEPNFLISETVRGEGGILRSSSGEAFMERYHEARDLAPRDVVSRAVFAELKKGKVYLDLTHKPASSIRRWFPTIYKECLLTEGIDITEDQIPVVPAAHYLCGGIKVDLHGESNIAGLFAFGECAATGVHGANRLASNSLLESVVFALSGAQKAKEYSGDEWLKSVPESERVNFDDTNDRKGGLLKGLQNLMWEHVGIVRWGNGLEYAIAQLQHTEDEVERINQHALHSSFVELRNMIAVAKLVATAASMRRETRGTHYLTEYPTQDDQNWTRHIRFVENDIEVI